MTRRLLVVLALVSASAAAAPPAKKKAPEPAPAPVEAPPADEPDADRPLTDEEITEAVGKHITGPKLVDLGNQTEIEVPAGMILLERAEAAEVLRKGGESVGNTVAIVERPDKDWWVIISYEDIGYVTDGDADKLDADELLSSYKEGTLAQNSQRRSMNVPELFIDGWTEKPHYERAAHHLMWGIDGHDSSSAKVVNYFTRTLGRNGYLEVQLVDSPDTIKQSIQDIAPIIAGTRFKSGVRYEDHKSEDKSSGMGLRALVLGGAGVAVLKGGGIFLKLLLIFKKGFIVVFAAIGGFFKWLFGRKKNADLAPPPSDDPPPPVG